jgi:hypothetical protein
MPLAGKQETLLNKCPGNKTNNTSKTSGPSKFLAISLGKKFR